jgi:lipoprotein-releasing system ATP-binding protein
MGIEMNNSVILKANNIVKMYRTEKTVLEVLKSVSLDIEENRISVIVGASGAGKSTLLHILSGLDRPDNGDVIYEEKNIFRLTDDKLARFRNRNIGFVFQFHHLLPEFTADENVAIPQLVRGVKFDDAMRRADELLSSLGLSERKTHKPAALSGGEQQRVALARALSNDPKIIFADEPTGNLDSENSEAIHNIILDLRNRMGKTFVIVTHNPHLVELADRVYEIKDGRIVQK